MGVSFAQPLAFWALLGLPLVLLLHFLQSRDRKEQVSTLFLLDVLPEETRRGAVFTRLLNGRQLWLQLLAVILLTLLLARPMWLKKESVQSIAIVLDMSASMRAFRDRLSTPVKDQLQPLVRSAGRTEWHVLPSDSARARLYAGDSLEAALDAIRTSAFPAGPHDPTPALVRARQLVGADGAVLWITDHPPARPATGVKVLGIGTPTPNSGISGIRIDSSGGNAQWEASLLHWGPDSREATLELEVEGETVSTHTATLFPDGITRVSGPLPKHLKRGVLRLTDDAFEPDNHYPFLVPAPGDLPYALRLEGKRADWARRVMETVPGTRQDTSTPRLLWRHVQGGVSPPVAPHEILLLTGTRAAPFVQPVAEDHPLTRDLTWRGLVAIPHLRTPFAEEQVLVWMGEVPLISLLPHPEGEQLLLNVDLRQSNADRVPAVVLLLHRYVNGLVTASKPLLEVQMETGQALGISWEPDELRERFQSLDGTIQERELSALPVHAPADPGFWTVWDAEAPRLRAAVTFGALEEADLRTAASTEIPESWVAGLRERNSEQAFLRPWLLGLLTLTLLGTWLTGSPGEERT